MPTRQQETPESSSLNGASEFSLDTSIPAYIGNRREAYLRRWHTEFLLREESLAEHQFYVARTSLMLCQALRNYGIADPDGEALMALALIHDATETELGDVPGFTKRKYPEIKSAISGVESLEVVDLYKELPIRISDYYIGMAFRVIDPEADDLEAQVVKYADVLDANIVANQEVKMGNYTLKRSVDLTTDWLSNLAWPWLQKLREKIHLP